MNIKISKLNKEDLDNIIEIENRVFTLPWTKFDFEMLLKEPAVNLVLKDEETKNIIGYLCSILQSSDFIHLLNFVIDVKYQNQGWGTRFLYFFIYEILFPAGVTKIILEVRESNKSAIALYHKFGFKGIDRYKNYYQKPKEDALVMFFETKKPR